MLRAFILQLSSQLDGRYTFLLRLYDSYRKASPLDPALVDCLHQLIRAFKDVSIALDALDESPREKYQEEMLQISAELRTWSEPGLHLIVLSRSPYPLQ